MWVHFERFTGLLYIIVLVWHFSPDSHLFLFTCTKIIIVSQYNQDIFHFCLTAFYFQLKSKSGNIFVKTTGMSVNLNIDDDTVTSRSQWHQGCHTRLHIHCMCSCTVNSGLVSSTKRVCTFTVRVVVQWIHFSFYPLPIYVTTLSDSQFLTLSVKRNTNQHLRFTGFSDHHSFSVRNKKKSQLSSSPVPNPQTTWLFITVVSRGRYRPTSEDFPSR